MLSRHHPVIVTCLLLLGGLVGGLAAAPAAGAVELSEALADRLETGQAILEDQPAEAAGHFEAIVEARPDFADGWRLLGRARQLAGELEGARAAMVEAIGRGRLTPEVLAVVLAADRAAGREEAAFREAELLTLFEPASRQWRLLAASLRGALGDAAGAGRRLERLLEEDASDAALWARRGNLALAAEAPERAAVALEVAWHLGFERRVLAARLSELATSMSAPRRGLAWYERARRLGAELSPQLAMSLAGQLERAGEAAAGRALLESVASGGSEEAGRAHLALARLAGREARPEAARRHFEAARARGEEDAAVRRYLARQALEAGELAPAAEHLVRVVALEGPEAAVLANLINIELRLGRRQAARGHLRTYLAHHGHDERVGPLLERWVAGAKRS